MANVRIIVEYSDSTIMGHSRDTQECRFDQTFQVRSGSDREALDQVDRSVDQVKRRLLRALSDGEL